MIDPGLSRLAAHSGLIQSWKDVHGQVRQVRPAVLQALLEALGLPCGSAAQIRESQARIDQAAGADCAMVFADAGSSPAFNYRGGMSYRVALEGGGYEAGSAELAEPGRVRIAAVSEPGYHMLEIGARRIPLVVAPLRCPSIAELAGRPHPRLWGVAVQLYGLRRSRQNPAGDDDGAGLTEAGDYAALAEFARAAAHCGADAVAISPIHAMFSADPARYSPYAPSSRIFLNANFADPGMVLGAEAMKAARAGAASHKPGPSEQLIDWPEVLRYRMEVFSQVFRWFESKSPAQLLRAFEDFRARGGQMLENHGCYEALHAYFAPILGASCGWQEWPSALRDPQSAAVRQFAAEHAADVRFHVFLQWLADEGIRLAQQSAVQEGMALGTIVDLAIGTDARGSHVWSRQDDFLDDVSIGAPPDLHQPKGQDWGLAAFSPRALAGSGYEPFKEILRAALSHAGGIRVDHILGLARMWLIPRGASAADGCYVSYPLDNMLRILALEATRHRAVVIGENLGTVPAGFNEHIYNKNVLGTSVLWFEHTAAEPGGAVAFPSSRSWPPQAVATTTTHDLPTVAGWWCARDLQWRRQLGQISQEESTALESARRQEKNALCQALNRAGEGDLHPCDSSLHSIRRAILSFVASAPAPLVLIPIEDLLGEAEQANLPGAPRGGTMAHPDWRRRQPRAAAVILDSGDVRECVSAVERGRRTP
ncbi:4-alpha-glucanotransferase [Eoetvoesiella caeni]|uniref:4-alpha-glucanotransferase n=2 Tax=Eoetvoesiella caeni TaxID=645616 RepID=A0A366HKW6_9BURK|nr:4-alpha-glucanotransferase [Eoetvoesiella caeni]